MEVNRDQFCIARMCRVLEVSRSGYNQWRTRTPSARSRANAVLDARVAAIHQASGASYGRVRIVHALHQAHGLGVGHERVRQSMKRQGLRCVY